MERIPKEERMKSLNTVIEVLEACQNDAIECFECPLRHETECELKDVTLAYLKEYQSAKDDLDEKRLKYLNAIAEFEDNPVLTWEQLKTMKDKPVWVEVYGNWYGKFWAFVEVVNDAYMNFYQKGQEYPEDLWKRDIGKSWQAYRKERA